MTDIGKGRVHSLDALRGVAAFAVVIDHWSVTFDWPVAAGMTAFGLSAARHLLQLGAPVIIIFFVLSAFVLTLSLENPRETYFGFLVKRFFRIYPTLIAGIFLSCCFYFAVRPHQLPGLSDWFDINWAEAPDPGLVAGHILLLGTLKFQQLDLPIWTLVHEVRISLFFPLIVVCVRRWMVPTLLLAFVASLVSLYLARHATPFAANWLMTVHYSFTFFCGAALALKRNAVRNFIVSAGLRSFLMMLVAAIALLLLFVRFRYPMCAGAILLVALCFSRPSMNWFFEASIPLYLGRISYSLYLVHLPILLLITHLFYGAWPNWVLITSGITSAVIVADIVNRVIERPSQRLGRFLAHTPSNTAISSS